MESKWFNIKCIRCFLEQHPATGPERFVYRFLRKPWQYAAGIVQQCGIQHTFIQRSFLKHAIFKRFVFQRL